MNVMAPTNRSKSRSSGTSTEFQIHKNHIKSLSHEERQSIIDFTEKKLERFVDESRDGLEKQKRIALLYDYTSASVAICWQSGRPHYIALKTKGQ